MKFHQFGNKLLLIFNRTYVPKISCLRIESIPMREDREIKLISFEIPGINFYSKLILEVPSCSRTTSVHNRQYSDIRVKKELFLFKSQWKDAFPSIRKRIRIFREEPLAFVVFLCNEAEFHVQKINNFFFCMYIFISLSVKENTSSPDSSSYKLVVYAYWAMENFQARVRSPH